MKFGEALEEVKKGALIARAGWNGKGMFVFQDRHEEQANELLRRSLFGPVPQVTISSRMEGKGFYDFVADDFEVWNYELKEQIKFEVAK